MKKNLYLMIALSFFMTVYGNVLKNGSFEAAGQQGTPSSIAQHWNIWLSKSDKASCSAEPSSDAQDGQRAMRLICNVPGKLYVNCAYAEKLPVTPGDIVRVSFAVKGKGTVYMQANFLDKNGKLLTSEGKITPGKSYVVASRSANNNWQQVSQKFTVPPGTSGLGLEIRGRGICDLVIDQAELTVDSGAVLENAKIKVQINPNFGGIIESFKLKDRDFELASKNTFAQMGGLAGDIVPAQTVPGLFRNSVYKLQVVSPRNKLIASRKELTGELAGLSFTKEFTLPSNSTVLKVALSAKNDSTHPLEFSCRVQNIIPNAEGAFSWPTSDWIKFFDYPETPINGKFEVKTDNLRTGWAAKNFKKANVCAVFNFAIAQTSRCYSYFDNSLATVEWYYKKVTLQPGESWNTIYSIALRPGEKEFYTDEFGKNQPKEPVVMKKLPPVEKQNNSLGKTANVFPFMMSDGYDLCNVLLGESPGSHAARVRQGMMVVANDAADNYFNGLYGVHFYDYIFDQFDKGDHNEWGDAMRDLALLYAPIRHLCNRDDIDLEPSIPKINKRMENLNSKVIQKLFKDYPDRFLCLFSADEIEGKNIDPMIHAHNEVQKLLPEGMRPIPYVNHTATELIPYVPVFIADYYPIRVEKFGGRNPWGVAEVFSKLVKQAGQTPVWFMPQAFGDQKIYLLPSVPEIRLMLNLAVASGVKGVVLHGCMNGGWEWVLNLYYYYSFYGAAGQRTEQWKTLGECAKLFTGIGSLLCRSHPAPVPKNVKLLNPTIYHSANNLYRGPAVTLYCLKSADATIICAVNNDIENSQKAIIDFTGQSSFDLSTEKNVPAGKFETTLPPGGAVWLLCDYQEKALDEFYKNRFEREHARFLIKARLAKAYKLPVPALSGAENPEEAYRNLMTQFRSLENEIDATEWGKCLLQLDKIHRETDRLDLLMTEKATIFVTPEMRKNTPVFREFSANASPRLEALRQRALACFYKLNKYYRDVEAGQADKVKDRLPELAAEVHAVTAEVSAL